MTKPSSLCRTKCAKSGKLKSKRRGHPEDRLQADLVSFFTSAVNTNDALLFAVPNGEKRDPVTAARLVGISAKQRDLLSDEDALKPAGLGVLPGAPDLILILSGGRTALIEVKTPEVVDALSGLTVGGVKMPKVVIHQAGTMNKAQRRFRGAAERLGHDYWMVRSVSDFIGVLLHYKIPASRTACLMAIGS